MTFQKWTDAQGGISALAAKIKMQKGTVGAWYRRKAYPQPLMMQKLVRMSRGKMSYEALINSTGRLTSKL